MATLVRYTEEDIICVQLVQLRLNLNLAEKICGLTK